MKKYTLEEKPICNAVAVFRERGNYLQRVEQFEESIKAYNEALRWNNSDVRSLLGRSLARVKLTHYVGALADAAKATALHPGNLKALQIRAQTEYEMCAFERALLLAHREFHKGRFPPGLVECAKYAEETVRECVDKTATKMLSDAASLFRDIDMKKEFVDKQSQKVRKRRCLMPLPTEQDNDVRKISLADKMRAEQISRLMASKYLERMAHDKYFLTALRNDERLTSANRHGSRKLLELANKALADVESGLVGLRERRPLYAARASEVAARERLSHTRKKQLAHTKKQNVIDAKRLIQTAQAMYEEHDTAKCVEHAEFGMEQISRKPSSLLPGKERYLQQLQDMVANAFLDQKRVGEFLSLTDRERRAYILLGIAVSRDSVLRVRPPPRRDARRRIQTLERALSMRTRESEHCYILHELARLNVETKQSLRARFYAMKCQAEARAHRQQIWLLNATFLLARCHLMQNNRPEARLVLLEAAGVARRCELDDVADLFDICVSIALEGEVGVTEQPIAKREKDMLSLMQDEDLRSEAQHLFKRMSVMPATRRFSVIPGAYMENTVPLTAASRRRSIVPKTQAPTRITHKSQIPLGFQHFDI